MLAVNNRVFDSGMGRQFADEILWWGSDRV